MKNLCDKYLKILPEDTQDVISLSPSGQRWGDGVARYFCHTPFSDSRNKNCEIPSYAEFSLGEIESFQGCRDGSPVAAAQVAGVVGEIDFFFSSHKAQNESNYQCVKSVYP